MPNWIEGQVVGRKDWANGLFTIEVAAPGVAAFEPGQFLQLAVQEGDKLINRPYSVASPFGDVIDFFIVLVDEGELTPKLFDLHPNDHVMVSERGAGSFTLSKSPDAKHLWLVATGTGIAPYIAMLRTDEPWSRYENIVIVHGVRHATDLAYADELSEFQKLHAFRFSYVPVVSRESPFFGLNGRITNVAEDGRLEEFCGVPFDRECCVMLCGNPQMLDDMESLLNARGLERHKSKSPGHVVVERYW